MTRKFVYGLVDESCYWYLKLKEELIKLGTSLTGQDQRIFVCFCNDKLFGIMVCFVDVLWGKTFQLECTINKLKEVFNEGSDHRQIFLIIINQREYIESISPAPFNKYDRQNLKIKPSPSKQNNKSERNLAQFHFCTLLFY